MPTEGTTRYVTNCNITENFNPRAHGGHDAMPEITAVTGIISIHVPTEGTTKHTEITLHKTIFQSTCPRGARQNGGPTMDRGIYFNPRAHGGHDPCGVDVTVDVLFQSTCPWRARRV